MKSDLKKTKYEMKSNLKKQIVGYVKVRSVDDPTTFAKAERQLSQVGANIFTPELVDFPAGFFIIVTLIFVMKHK